MLRDLASLARHASFAVFAGQKSQHGRGQPCGDPVGVEELQEESQIVTDALVDGGRVKVENKVFFGVLAPNEGVEHR